MVAWKLKTSALTPGKDSWKKKCEDDDYCHFDPYGGLSFDELTDRIATQGGIPLPSSTSSFIPTHGIEKWLAWNKNPQCPQKYWSYELDKRGNVNFTDMEEVDVEGHYDVNKSGNYYCIDAPQRRFLPQLCTALNPKDMKNRPQGWKIIKNDRRLIVPRHTYYDYTLYAADYVEHYFPKSYQDGKHIIGFGDGSTGFWLIRADEADFVYAILKSGMFKAWCELTAYVDDQGKGHFAQGMWGHFSHTKYKTTAFKTQTLLKSARLLGSGKRFIWKSSNSGRCDSVCRKMAEK
ncbi:MAG: hypothetical protein IKT06_02245 [Aeriscardovia sp.]|nr:hypothetical protein [Aeriscardovia sp.]